MYVQIVQKCSKIDDKLVAFVDVALKIGDYGYKVRFDEKTKKRFKAFCQKEGFIIGRVDTPPPDKKIKLKGDN